MRDTVDVQLDLLARVAQLERERALRRPTLRDEYTATAVAFTSTTYADPSTPGPTITIPRDGDYLVEWWAQATHGTQFSVNWMAVKLNSDTTLDANGVLGQPFVATGQVLFPTGRKVMTLLAGDVLKLQYKTNTGTLTINGAGGVNPYLSATPYRPG